MSGISRRAMLVSGLAAGSALLVGWGWRRLDDGDATEAFGAAAPGSVALNPWIRIAPDGLVTVGIHRAEMGQGIVTTIAMIVAEELDADWSKVRYEFTPVDRDYYNFGFVGRGQPLGDTAGRPFAQLGTAAIRGVMHAFGLGITVSSASTIDAWDVLRPVAAAARAMLVEAAAVRLGVPAQNLRTRDGRVADPGSGRLLGYGELAAEAARRSPPADPPLKDPAEYRLVGRDPPRLELPAKVDGSARYGLDVRLPGLRFAAIKRCPQFGGTLRRFDDAAARAVPGYERTLQLAPDMLAAVATDTWAAQQAIAKVEIDWAPPPPEAAGLSSRTLLDQYRGAFDSPDAVYAVERKGADASATALALIEREYAVPFLAHACMEPMNATALRHADGRLEVWAPTQAPSLARSEAARMAGLEAESVTFHSTLLGGGFGRRAELDYVLAAVTLAIQMPGVPVQAFWSRFQDLRHDCYRPAAACRMRARLCDDGAVAAIDAVVVAQSVLASNGARTPSPRATTASKDKSIVSGIADSPYDWPDPAVAFVGRELAVPVGFWRSVSHSYSAFFVESFVDELADQLGVAPLELRRRWLTARPRALAVLEAAAARGRLGEALPPGEGRGIALSESHGSVAAHVVHVSAAPTLRVLRVTSVLDCGRIVRPDGVRAQVEGSVVDGLWAALRCNLRIEAGRVVQGNFHDYPLLRINEVPPIDVHLLDSTLRPGGVGEPALPAVAPALCNAIFAATGRRIRQLPVEEAIDERTA